MLDFLNKLNLQAINPGAFSGASWCSGLHGKKITSSNPANEEKIAEVYECSMQDYEYVVQRAQQAFLTWRCIPAPQRGELIRQMGIALRHHKDLLGSLVSLEMGKSKQEGDGEVQEMIDIADFAVGQSRMLYGKTMHSERPFHRLYEQWHPYGVVGVISAFNFPVAVWAWNAFIAAVCGNVTIWKPSTKTPLCAIAIQYICNQVLSKNQYPEVFSLIIPRERAVSSTMLQDTRLPLISFTGSTSVGREVASQVARRLGRTILELGGNNAVIIDELVNLNLAIPSVVFGALGTAGQRCTSTRRLFVHQKIYPEVLKRLKSAYQQVTIGNPLDSNHLMGPLIDQNAVDQFQIAIDRIKHAGGQIYYGGGKLKRVGFYVEPTLIIDLDNDSNIIQEETFAPILYVMPFNHLEEAILLQNAVPQGLSSALFTQNLCHAEHFLSTEGSDCGIANINISTSGAEIGGAFGGEKDTGGGRESGSDAWKAYMRRQTNTINWGNDLPLAQGIHFNIN